MPQTPFYGGDFGYVLWDKTGNKAWGIQFANSLSRKANANVKDIHGYNFEDVYRVALKKGREINVDGVFMGEEAQALRDAAEDTAKKEILTYRPSGAMTADEVSLQDFTLDGQTDDLISVSGTAMSVGSRRHVEAVTPPTEDLITATAIDLSVKTAGADDTPGIPTLYLAYLNRYEGTGSITITLDNQLAVANITLTNNSPGSVASVALATQTQWNSNYAISAGSREFLASVTASTNDTEVRYAAWVEYPDRLE